MTTTATQRRKATRIEVFAGDTLWDLVIVGGGITGVAIAHEAARVGLKVLLLERQDFAAGASSRSSKLVHGGFRYLKEGKILLTRDSVREREQLVRAAAGLVTPNQFLILDLKTQRVPMGINLGLRIYDWLAGMRSSESLSVEEVLARVPGLPAEQLLGGYVYRDAQTDDARLVLRVLSEARRAGARALNYVHVHSVSSRAVERSGEPIELEIEDLAAGTAPAVAGAERGRATIRARVVINATGAWADRLRGTLGLAPRMRPLRGSHLVFSRERVPLPQPVSLFNPVDRRPLVIYPWEGVTVIGTTDLDHPEDLDIEPAISAEEVAYLMAVMTLLFPDLELTTDDIVSTWSGVRPVIGSGQKDPSKESRDHAVWVEEGLLTVTGGKLTTFRLIALDALNKARDILGGEVRIDSIKPDHPAIEPVDGAALQAALLEHEGAGAPATDPAVRERLLGRHGEDAAAVVRDVSPPPGRRAQAVQLIPGTTTTWAELQWAAGHESVVHLDDLLLRRTRVGLCVPEGGARLHEILREWCQPALGWDDDRWAAELERYEQIWRARYSVP